LPLSVASTAAVAWLVWREVRYSGSAAWGISSTLGQEEKCIGSRAGQTAS
jgi:hypothetical protein